MTWQLAAGGPGVVSAHFSRHGSPDAADHPCYLLQSLPLLLLCGQASWAGSAACLVTAFGQQQQQQQQQQQKRIASGWPAAAAAVDGEW
eukprot:CAMPEP_0202423752 /NCGR_PEP_ID=MMETSP1128-20130828/51545_1 /ASSEMBLY_ACC=CAM_ASM_000463 /TAXON_ID=3047 /ORGANISM="Dunaliella tertiolecta, Strain CCMP1320" /LENGTH=88 /DNA_ID=CAMNT_0049031875 /DNA_START=319 /DNA_END=585 /DNA_ORIENTATION=-